MVETLKRLLVTKKIVFTSEINVHVGFRTRSGREIFLLLVAFFINYAQEYTTQSVSSVFHFRISGLAQSV
jgi:hypothetical protein